jgi:hypothetical protein
MGGRPVGEAGSITAICEPIVWKEWEPGSLTALWASTSCYRDSLFFYLYITWRRLWLRLFVCTFSVIAVFKCTAFWMWLFPSSEQNPVLVGSCVVLTSNCGYSGVKCGGFFRTRMVEKVQQGSQNLSVMLLQRNFKTVRKKACCGKNSLLL